MTIIRSLCNEMTKTVAITQDLQSFRLTDRQNSYKTLDENIMKLTVIMKELQVYILLRKILYKVLKPIFFYYCNHSDTLRV